MADPSADLGLTTAAPVEATPDFPTPRRSVEPGPGPAPEPEPEPGGDPVDGAVTPAIDARRWGRPDTLLVAGYMLLALWTTARFWEHGRDFTVRTNPPDESWFEWLMAHGARLFTHPENPFFTTSINFPDGANLMANNSILGLALPLAPVTLLFGAHVGFVVATMVSLAGTAAAWYFVLSRHFIRSRTGALVAGLLIGFGPGAIAHAAGQLNVITNFVLPFIVWRVLDVRDNPRPVRNGIILGLLVAYQVFLSEELLFITGLALGLVLVSYGVARPAEVGRHWRAFARNLLIGAAVAGVLVAYPLWFQFTGPQHWHGLMDLARYYSNSVDSFYTLPSQSIGGDPTIAPTTVGNSEQNAYLGLPLVVLLVLVVARFWRDPWIRAFGISAIALASLTLGRSIWLFGNDTGVPGPYKFVGQLPLFDSLVPSRLGLGVMGLSGIILAVVSERIADRATGAALGRDLRLGWIAALAAAVVPILPTPLTVEERPHVPAFLADGTWRRYIDDKHSLVTFPLPSIAFSEPERWVANIDLGVAIAHGYVLSPTSKTDLTASYNPAERPTTTLVNTVPYTNTVPTVTDADRRAAVDDLRYWHAAIVMVQPGQYEDELRQTAERLLGPGQYIGGAWIWDVRGITAS
jgi:hypothetical protein